MTATVANPAPVGQIKPPPPPPPPPKKPIRIEVVVKYVTDKAEKKE